MALELLRVGEKPPSISRFRNSGAGFQPRFGKEKYNKRGRESGLFCMDHRGSGKS